MRLISRETFPVEAEQKKMRHASTILPLPDGSVIGAYFAGAYEAEPDVDVYIAIRGPSGLWSPSRKVSAEEGIAHWNPVLARSDDGSMTIFYKVGFEIASWRTMARVSHDNGLTWGESREIVPGDSGGRGPVRNKILATREGMWIAGASLEKGASWTAFADISTDKGMTWSRSADIAIDFSRDQAAAAEVPDIAVTPQSFRGRGIIQPTLWQDRGGRVHMLLRSTEGFAYRSDSPDGGVNWTIPYKTAIPNNNSALDVICLDDGTLILAHNPVGGNWGVRTPLVLSVSKDNGLTWERTIALEEGQGEFSYPAIAASADAIYVSWTKDRTAIGFARISTD